MQYLRNLQGINAIASDMDVGPIVDFVIDSLAWTLLCLMIEAKRSTSEEIPVPTALVKSIHVKAGVVELQVSKAALDQELEVCALSSTQANKNQANSSGEDIGGLGSPRHAWTATELTDCSIFAADGELGHVEDLLVDTSVWHVPYFVVNAWNWLPGKKLLIPTACATNVTPAASSVRTDLRRREVRLAPPMNAGGTIDRAYEEQLHAHYDRRAYWL